MRIDDLRMGAGGQGRVVLHPRLTVFGGLDQDARAAMADAIIGGLAGARTEISMRLMDNQGGTIELSNEGARASDGSPTTAVVPHLVPDEEALRSIVLVTGLDLTPLPGTTDPAVAAALDEARAEHERRKAALDATRGQRADADRWRTELRALERRLKAAEDYEARVQHREAVERIDRCRAELTLINELESTADDDSRLLAAIDGLAELDGQRAKLESEVLAIARAAALLDEVRSEAPSLKAPVGTVQRGLRRDDDHQAQAQELADRYREAARAHLLAEAALSAHRVERPDDLSSPVRRLAWVTDQDALWSAHRLLQQLEAEAAAQLAETAAAAEAAEDAAGEGGRRRRLGRRRGEDNVGDAPRVDPAQAARAEDLMRRRSSALAAWRDLAGGITAAEADGLEEKVRTMSAHWDPVERMAREASLVTDVEAAATEMATLSAKMDELAERLNTKRLGLLSAGDRIDGAVMEVLEGLPNADIGDLATRREALARAQIAALRRARDRGRARSRDEALQDLQAAQADASARWDPAWAGRPLPQWEAQLGLLQRVRAQLLERLASVDDSALAEQEEAVAAASRRVFGLEQQLLVTDTNDPKEWARRLLSRVAAVSAVGGDGEPLPLVLDEALVGLEEERRLELLGLLSRVGERVQVIYLTGDAATLDWAGEAAKGRKAKAFGLNEAANV